MSIQQIDIKRYIELNSTYRNRNIYPNPASFKVNVGNSGQKTDAINALDSYSRGQSSFVFQGNQASFVGQTMTGTPQSPIISALDKTDDYYQGLTLINDATLETSFISDWDNGLKQFSLETTFNEETWINGQTASIVDPSNRQEIFIPGGISDFQQTFVGQYLYNFDIDEYRIICDYDPLTKTLLLEKPFSSLWAIDNYYEIVSEQAVSIDTTQSVSKISAVLAAIELNINDGYRGRFIKFSNLTDPTISYGTRLVTSYYGSITVPPYQPLGPTPPTQLKEVVFTPGIDTGGIQNVRYQIINFTKDIGSYLNYSSIWKNERAYYRLILDNLILPNRKVDSPEGKTTAFYPYVYVVFSNDSLGTNSLFNSNNPNSQRAVFRCPITDIADIELSTFIKVRSSMTNILRFNPFEDLVFQVYLPNGEIFKTIEDDNLPPENPRAFIQISCTVSFEKIKYN